ncbi:Hsp70 family protein [Halorubellus salinus]|uniref:Hsp70 family protein n=1 Tax=Halorubellus salinus TaxID=755309 RepID=UPI001D0711C4|nr:Hsp70 family protein [Halorubellus salinus]
MASEKILGIDLGTTNSGMAIVEAGDPQMLSNNEGNRLTPSVVHYDEDGDALVGRRAISREPAEPDQVIREIKRHMGEEDYTEKIQGKDFTPPEVSTEILQKLKRDAEEYLEDDVSEAVVTVPAYFTINQTAATKTAAENAGFDETHLLNEPTAAALAYGNGKDLDETLLVYDFGGGTLDISIIDVADDEFKVLATDGDNNLGGADFDRALMELLAERYEDEHGVDIRDDTEISANLRTEAEQTKIELSSDTEAEAMAPFLGQIEGEIVTIEETVTRDTFEDITADLRDRAIDPIQKALEKAELTTDDIDNVLLVGGSTMMPAIQDRLEEFVGLEPTKTIDPDKIVAQGAAVYAQREIETGYRCRTCGKEFDALLKLNEHYDEVHTEEDSDKFECTNCDETFDTKDERKAHQAKAHSGSDSDDGDSITPTGPSITDIISHSLGTELKDGSMDVIIEQGTSIEDATGIGLYTTTRDDQTRVPVGVFQGESNTARENKQIGEVTLSDIPPRPAGVPRIEVTYDIDKDGILHVEAIDQESGETVNGDFDL